MRKQLRYRVFAWLEGKYTYAGTHYADAVDVAALLADIAKENWACIEDVVYSDDFYWKRTRTGWQRMLANDVVLIGLYSQAVAAEQARAEQARAQNAR